MKKKIKIIKPPHYPYYETWKEYFDAIKYRYFYKENKNLWHAKHTDWDNTGKPFVPVPGLIKKYGKGPYKITLCDLKIKPVKLNVTWTKETEVELKALSSFSTNVDDIYVSSTSDEIRKAKPISIPPGIYEHDNKKKWSRKNLKHL